MPIFEKVLAYSPLVETYRKRYSKIGAHSIAQRICRGDRRIIHVNIVSIFLSFQTLIPEE